MTLLIAVIISLIIPFYLCWQLAYVKIYNYRTELIKIIFVGSYVFAIYFTAIWPLTTNFYFRYLIVICFAFAILKLYFSKSASIKTPAFSTNIQLKQKADIRRLLSPTLHCILSFIFIFQIISSAKGFKKPSNSIDLVFPLKNGIFYVAHGGDDLMINHHYLVPAQKYALDIIQLNFWGFRTQKLTSTHLNNYEIYEANIYSPCNGKVIDCIDEFVDQKVGASDRENLAGNFIAIKINNSNIVVVMAHLKNKSILVHKGDVVDVGQPLAQVGNSGNTSEPHLHIHCILDHSGDLLFNAIAVPITFSNRFLTRNDILINL